MGILYRKYQTGGRILTYKKDSDWFDGHARYSDDLEYDESIRKRVYSGNWGYNPETQTLHKLDADDQVVVDPQTKKWATQSKEELKKEYQAQAEVQKAKQAKDREGKVAHRVPTEEAWNPYGAENAGKTFWVTPKQAEQMRKDQLAHNMNAVRNHPLWMAPGMIYGGTIAPALGLMAETPQIAGSTKNIVTGEGSAMDWANVLTMGASAKAAPIKKFINKTDELIPRNYTASQGGFVDLSNSTSKSGGVTSKFKIPKPPSLSNNMFKRWVDKKLGKIFPEEIKVPDTKLPELKKLDPNKFDESLEAWRKKNQPTPLEKEIEKQAKAYYKNVTSPQNKARAAAMDAEQGTNYTKAIEDLEAHGDYLNIGETMSDRLNIKIKPNPKDGTGGYSTVTTQGRMKQTARTGEFGEHAKQSVGPSHLSEREIVVYDDMPLSDVKRTISHEGKHHYTLGQDPKFYDKSNLNSSVETPAEISKSNPQFADDLIQPAFPNRKGSSKTMHEYLSDPVEIDAYVNTNLRDELVDQGILKNHWDNLDDTKLAQYLMGNPSKYSKRFIDMAGKNFVSNFNKGVYTAIPAAGLAGYAATEQHRKGGILYKKGVKNISKR